MRIRVADSGSFDIEGTRQIPRPLRKHDALVGRGEIWEGDLTLPSTIHAPGAVIERIEVLIPARLINAWLPSSDHFGVGHPLGSPGHLLRQK